MVRFGLFLVSVLMSFSAQATVFQFQPGAGKSISGVNLSDSVMAQLGGGAKVAKRVAAGLREKPTLLGMVQVYVSELFLSAPEKWDRTESMALTTLGQSELAVMRMTFVRAVDAEKIAGAFLDGALKNAQVMESVGLSVKSGPYKAFLDAVAENGEVAKGQSLVIAVEQQANKSVLIFEDAGGNTYRFDAAPNISAALFSLWLGVPADEGVQKLKEQLLAGEQP